MEVFLLFHAILTPALLMRGLRRVYGRPNDYSTVQGTVAVQSTTCQRLSGLSLSKDPSFLKATARDSGLGFRVQGSLDREYEV